MKTTARTLAEQLWGYGGTRAYKTNRKNAYYYSCSAHGGYIVFTEALTNAEKEQIDKYIEREYINLLVQGSKIIGIDYSPIARSVKNKRFKIDPSKPYKWEIFEFYAFEEDCAWAILEKFTDIRADGSITSESKRLDLIESIFNRYYAKAA